MSDKHSEDHDTPFNICMNGKELVLNSLPMKPLPSSQPSLRRPSPGIQDLYLFLNSENLSRRAFMDQQVDTSFEKAFQFEKLQKCLKKYETSKPHDSMNVWKEKILQQETVLT